MREEEPEGSKFGATISKPLERMLGIALLLSLILDVVLAERYVQFEFGKYTGRTAETSKRRSQVLDMLKKRAVSDSGLYPRIDIENQRNFYSVDLMIGSPPQNVTVQIDTGSSDLWVVGSNNLYCKSDSLRKRKATTVESSSKSGGYDGNGYPTASSDIPRAQRTMDCNRFGVFNMEESSTSKSNNTGFSTSYGDNSYADGLWIKDVMTLDAVNISDLLFAVANVTNSTMGVLGIGLASIESYTPNDGSKSAVSKEYNNFPLVLKQNKVIQKVAYSLFLDNDNADYGQLLFGAVDHSKYSGDLYTLPLVNSLYNKGVSTPEQLEITLDGIGLQTQKDQITLFNQKLPALLDSGTTITYLPRDVFEIVVSQMKATTDSNGMIKLKSCPSADDNAQLVFSFSGVPIYVDLASFIEKNGDKCSVNIMAQDDDGIVLGDNFLSYAYVVYDLEDKEISIAQANFNSSKGDIEPILSTVPGAIKAPGYSASFSVYPSSYSAGSNFFTFSQKSILTATSSGKQSKTTGHSSGHHTSTITKSASTTTKSKDKKNVAASNLGNLSSLFGVVLVNLLSILV